MIRLALALAAALIALVPRGTDAASSTIITSQPVQGVPYSAGPIRDNFGRAASDINALGSWNAGATPPSAPGLGSSWLDTTSTPFILKTWSVAGSQWVPIAAYNQTSSQWIPPIGGGTFPSITSAATTNLGSVSQAGVYVTGNQSIASFGSTTPAGQMKLISFTGSPTLVYNSSFMIIPAKANVTLSPGDSIIAVSLGGGAWIIWPTGNVLDLRQSARNNPIPGSYYVAITGDDGADCQTDTSTGGHGPCLTIARALRFALASDGRSASLIINIGPGLFAENIAVNGAAVGVVNSANFITNKISSPLVTLKGAGSASTTLQNVATIDGQSYCYTVLANNGGMIDLQDMRIRADSAPGTCIQSPVFVQTYGIVFIDHDVILGPANGNLISGEEGGQVYVDAGCGNCNSLTLDGGSVSGNGISLDAGSIFTADSTVNVTNQTFGGGWMVFVESNSLAKFSGNPGLTSGGTVSARNFYIGANSSILLAHPPAAWPGNAGAVVRGGMYYASDDGVCAGGAVGCSSVTSATGLGGSGTVAISDQSGVYGGAIQLNPVTGGGPAPGSAGTAYLGWRTVFPAPGICTANVLDGTEPWDDGATVKPVSFGNSVEVAFIWSNNGTNLTSGKTYFIIYTCTTGK